ncbi:MAG TPA: LuxR C-terminal-related transcriptional regulator [Pseudonocardia sp.]|jgi:predicted ATPase/DNA-binding CsgD family transcriptional regulator|nr:LuxR C-terminal-related transcriptional regulator [Pseudonocardia sp.]
MNADEWEQVQRLHRDGVPITAIAARLQMARNTVRRALRLEFAPNDHRGHRGSVVDAWEAEIAGLIAEDPTIGIAEIGRRIGWTHSRTTLARRVRLLRDRKTEPGAAPITALQYATSFVGRRAELRTLRDLLGGHRLVTIAGPGGVGKTRLALHAASEFRHAFPDGVGLVELAALGDPELLAQTFADGLGIAHRGDSATSVQTVLIEYLRDRRMLLIVDNCEHLVEDCAELLVQLLRATTGVVVVATSRESLGLAEEFVFVLDPLSTATERGHDGAALRLFTDRAGNVLSGFSLTEENRPVVARLCQRLDGLPLAIELACARLRALSLPELAARLDDRLELLNRGSRGAPVRHRSLQATMDWSFDLCTRDQQLLWARASVFVGGFDLEMAEEVCSDELELPRTTILDTVSALVAKSVIRREESASTVRFHMLRSIREHGLVTLSAPEQELLRDRQITWCANLLHRTGQVWFGPEQVNCATLLRQNHANLRAVLGATLREAGPDGPATAARMLGSVTFLWACGFSVREHQLWLERVLVPVPAIADSMHSRLLATLALVRILQGDRDAALAPLHEAQRRAVIAADPVAQAFAVNVRGLATSFAGDFLTARAQMLEAAAMYETEDGAPELVCMLRIHLGMHYSFTGELPAAADQFQQARALTSSAGECWLRSYAVFGLGLVALLEGDAAVALRLGAESLTLQAQVGDPVGTSLAVDLLGWAEAESGSAQRSAVLLGAASSRWESIGQQLYGSRHWVDTRSHFVRRARARLGSATFDRLYARGTAMASADVLHYAMGEGDSPRPGDGTRSPDVRFTRREDQVLEHVVLGRSNKEIASALTVSPRTVEGHVERIRRKLGVDRRSQIITLFQGRPPTASARYAGPTAPGPHATSPRRVT